MGTEDLSSVTFHGLFSSIEAIKCKRCIRTLTLGAKCLDLKNLTNRYRKITC